MVGIAQQTTDMVDDNTRWAADRTYWAADRTLIAWIRTAISMIGFGLAVGKIGDYVEEYDATLDPYHSMKIVGVALITLGVLGVAAASIQNRRIERRIANRGFHRVELVPLGLGMAMLVLVLGIFAAIAIFL